MKATKQPSLGEQVTKLEHERDGAKQLAVSLEAKNTQLAADTTKDINDLKKQHNQQMASLRKQVIDAEIKSLVEATVLEQVRREKSTVQDELSRLEAAARPTTDTIEALRNFLNDNSEIKGDKFFGVGKEFDHLRSLVRKIPKTAPAKTTASAGKKRAAPMDEEEDDGDDDNFSMVASKGNVDGYTSDSSVSIVLTRQPRT